MVAIVFSRVLGLGYWVLAVRNLLASGPNRGVSSFKLLAFSFLTLIFSLSSLISFAQFPISPNARDENNLKTGYWTILLDSTDKVVHDPDSVEFYRIIRFEKGKPVGKVRDFFRTYGRQWDGYLSSVDPDIRDGETNYYYENGKVMYHGFYKNDKLTGPFQQYDDKGVLRAEGQMVRDTAEGRWKVYFPSGALSVEYDRVKNIEHGIYLDYYESGKLYERGQKTNGEKSGFWITYHESGAVAKHKNYLNGKLDGPYKYWNDQGILTEDGQWKDDDKTGHWTLYLDSGEKESEGDEIDGFKSGKWQLYYPSGKLKTEGEWIEGTQIGPHVFYFENGQVSGTGVLEKSLYTGFWTFWRADGSLREKSYYLRDTLNGYTIYYNEKGIIKSEGKNIMGIKDDLWKYYDENGILSGTEVFAKGIQHGDNIDYYPDGKLKGKRNYVNGKKEGENLEFFQNGNPSVSGSYKNNLKEGPWKWYFPSGHLQSSYFYVAGKFEGRWINYYDNGKVESAGNGVKDSKDGLIKYYFANGQLKKEGYYINHVQDGKWVYYDSLTGKISSDGMVVKGKLDGRWKFYKTDGSLESISYYKMGFWETRSNIYDSISRLSDLKEYDLALKAVEWLEKVIKRDVDKNHIANSSPYYYYANIYFDKADYKTSLTYYEKYEQSVKLLQGDTVSNYHVALNGIALNKLKLGQIDEAIALYDRSLKMTSRSDLDYGIGVGNKAFALYDAKRPKEAEDLLLAEWNFARKDKGDTSSQALGLLKLTGLYYYDWSNEYDKALAAYQKYYKTLTSHVKRSDPRIVEAMRQLALTNKAMLKRRDAMMWFSRELKLEDSLQHNNTLPYLNDMRELAGIYIDMYKQDSALLLLNKMLAIIQATNREGTSIHARTLDGKANVEYYMEDYVNAIETWKQAISLFEKLGETKLNTYTAALQGVGLAISYSATNQTAEAEPWFMKALSVCYTNQGDESAQYLRLLSTTGNFYRGARQYHKADSILRKAERLALARYGKDSEWYASCEKELGLLELDQSNYQKSIQYFETALIYWRLNLANDPLECIDVMNNLGKTYRWAEKYEESEKVLRESMNVFEKNVGGLDARNLSTRTQLAELYVDRRIYSEAEKIFLAVLSDQAKLSGTQSSAYSYNLEDMGYFYNTTGEYKKAEKYFLQYESLALKIKGRLSYAYMDANFKLADLYYNLDLEEKADEFYKKTVALAYRIYGPHALEYGRKVRRYAEFCENTGRNAEAAKYFTTAANIAKEIFGQESLGYSFYLIDQARVYLNIGRYAEAEVLLQKAKAITSQHMLDATDDYRASIGLLARFYQGMGRYDEAAKLFEEVLAVVEKDGKHSFYAKMLAEAGGNDYDRGLNEKAVARLEEALKILLEELDPGHYEVLEVHNTLGLIALQTGKLDDAEAHFKYCIDQRIIAKTDMSPIQTVSLHNQAGVLMEKGKFAESEKLYQQGAAILKAKNIILAPEQQAIRQDNVAMLYQAWGKYDLAEKNWLEVLQKIMSYIHQNFAFMSDYEKTKFWQKNKEDFEFFNTFAMLRQSKKPAILGTMYDNQLATKGILLSASNKIRKRIYESRDSTLINHYYEWVQTREQLAKEYAEATSDKKTVQADSLERKVNLLEKELSLSAEDVRADRPATWKDVQKVLGPDEAALEIVRFHYFDRHKTDSVLYAVLVLTAETKLNPQVAFLPKGEFLEQKAYKFYRNAIIAQLEDTVSYRHFWAAIEPLVKNKKKLYISPDGVYNQINLKTLKNSSGKYLMENQDFIIVSNTRDLVAIKGRKKLRLLQTASLIGNPKFFRGQQQDTKSGGTRDFSLEDRSGIAALPGTKQEIETVENLLTEKGWRVSALVEGNATEKQVKDLPSSRVVHVATHGFFQDDKNTSWTTQDPMLRAGILLSGAANFIQNKEETNGENGILTAYEAANLSLEGTEMVVLSACETARGEIQQGEGVYGLQRAFITAGAESLIMSLWKVDDEATQKLMSLFYENWMKGMDKNAALNQAQRDLKKLYPHPYYWGAFVMMRG